MRALNLMSFVLVAFGVVLVSGCASVTRGTMDSLVVESTPSGAEVTITRTDREFTEKERQENSLDDSGAIVGSTPSSFRLKREGNYKVVLGKKGYETVESTVSHAVAKSGARGMAGNILLGGVVGAVVDSNTGAMHDLQPNPLNVTLAPLEEADEDAEDAPSVSPGAEDQGESEPPELMGPE